MNAPRLKVLLAFLLLVVQPAAPALSHDSGDWLALGSLIPGEASSSPGALDLGTADGPGTGGHGAGPEELGRSVLRELGCPRLPRTSARPSQPLWAWPEGRCPEGGAGETVLAPAVPNALRAKVDPALLRRALEAFPVEDLKFLVRAQGEANLETVPAALFRDDRRAAVVERLQAVAAAGQAHLVPSLLELREAGHVQSFRPFWIFNGLAVTGDREALLTLAARDDVLSISPDRWQGWITPDPALASGTSALAAVDWGIAQIRADQVWSAMEIDGAGVVVAAMDTGVDWQHPLLRPSYRGWHEGTPVHAGSWYDATGGGALYPVDGMGHGTHVMGLLAGQDGVGVAPGACWIAVRAFDNQGYALDSWIHAGFEWLLAPAGDPALAPDIVNNSWSSAASGDTEFRPDVQALLAAGILPVFNAGNAGPDAGSIGAPASYPEGLAVGASGPDDEVVWFSGRGPSPFGGTKPEVVGPGVNLRSTLPGGVEGTMSGTSMAAPLVAGVAAAVLQADPALSVDQLIHVITRTAVPVGETWPNMDAGWGRVDALEAVASALNPGYLEGEVRGSGYGPLAGATVRATEHGGGATAATQTDVDGSWWFAVSPGVYDLEATAFGYAPEVSTGLTVLTGTVTTHDFILSPLPTGVVGGRVTAAESGGPLPAVVRVHGTPVTTTATITGTYFLSLPGGSYTITVEHWGYRVGRATAAVVTGGETQQDFQLESSPTVLLVDSGSWYYGSEIEYFQTALEDQDYLFSNWRIKSPFQDIPTITDLRSYDAVIWSSPGDSPGYIGAGEVISGYLAAGGNLILSGQDVGFWDSGASGLFWSRYYQDMLVARFRADNAGSQVLSGTTGGPLGGLTLTLNGPGGAMNQTSPDSVEPVDRDWAVPLLDYVGQHPHSPGLRPGAVGSSPGQIGHGGVAAGLCLPYRSFYLSFGLEGVGERHDRAEVMERALDWFNSPRPAAGVELAPAESLLIAPAGASVTHTVRLRNTGEAGMGDTYTVTLLGADWPTTVVTASFALSPCQTVDIQVRADVPVGLGWDQSDRAVLTVRSAVSPTLVATAALVSKTPASILLVDDDRWYNQEEVYQVVLDAGGFRYDQWDTGWQTGGQAGSPPASVLQQYPLTIWFTAYDWYGPITDLEAAALEDYLAGGGRLFLSSQDALYYQAGTVLSSRYLGVLTHREDVTPTVAFGAGGRLGLQGPMTLDYPFRNFSDGLVSTASATVESYSDRGWASGLTNGGVDWKTAFLSFPFEALPAVARMQVMDRVVGWLGWLGQSEFEASARTIPAGGWLAYTATLRNDGPESTTAVFSNTLPAAFNLISGTVEGGSYDGRAIRWQGTLPAGGKHLIRYAGTASATLTSTAVISYAEHGLAFHPQVRVWLDAPDLSASTLAAEPTVVMPGRRVTYTLIIRNLGQTEASEATGVWTLPADLTVLTGTLEAAGGSASLEGRSVSWGGSVAAGQSVTITVTGLTLPGPQRRWLSSAAVLDDGVTEVLVRGHVLELRPAFIYLPIFHLPSDVSIGPGSAGHESEQHRRFLLGREIGGDWAARQSNHFRFPRVAGLGTAAKSELSELWSEPQITLR